MPIRTFGVREDAIATIEMGAAVGKAWDKRILLDEGMPRRRSFI